MLKISFRFVKKGAIKTNLRKNQLFEELRKIWLDRKKLFNKDFKIVTQQLYGNQKPNLRSLSKKLLRCEYWILGLE